MSNPLKEALTAKKLSIDKVKDVLSSTKDLSRWLALPLDEGPPFVAPALFHAVAMCRVDVVEALIQHGADARVHYKGDKLYAGTVKPNCPAIDSVRARKGRFIGTMLGDRLEKIEEVLLEAAERQNLADSAPEHASAAGGPRPPSALAHEAGRLSAVGELKPSVEPMSVAQQAKKRRSVMLPAAKGLIMHTHGHPIDQYEINDKENKKMSTKWREGWHKESFQAVAIKVEVKPDGGGHEVAIWEEIAVMRKLAHPNVVALVETFEDEQRVYMVLQLDRGGSLFDRIVAEEGNFPKPPSRRVSLQLASSIAYLHSRQVCHRDVQPCNFHLVDDVPLEDAHVRLMDFTTSKEFGPDCLSMQTKVCTPSYVAPEVIAAGDSPYCEKIDVWSLGAVFFFVLCGLPPFQGDTEVEVLKQVRKADVSFEPAETWRSVPEGAKDLVGRMLAKDPGVRLSSLAVTEHPWLSSE